MKFGDVINMIVYTLLIICLILWNFISNIFPGIDLRILLIILISVLLASEINIILAVNKIEKKLTILENNELIEPNDLTHAINKAISSQREIKTLRIYALSTTVIAPIIRSSLKCKVGECKLLLRNLNDEEYNKLFGDTVRRNLDTWEGMKNDKKIGRIEQCYFDYIPSEYNIIIDDEILIIGNYLFTDNDKSHITINDVITIANARLSGKKVIDMYTKRFDETFQYFLRHGGACIREEQTQKIGLSYSEGFNFGLMEIFKKNKHIKSMDILANTSKTYFHSINDCNVFIDDLRLLVWRPKEKSTRHYPIDEESIDGIDTFRTQAISSWLDLQKNGKIKKLEIKYYEFDPTFHFAIIDKTYIHSGMYKMESTFPGYHLYPLYTLDSNDSSYAKSQLKDKQDFFNNIFENWAYSINIPENNSGL